MSNEFVQMMKDWRRMCNGRSCDGCDLKDSCDIDPDSRTDADIRKIDTRVTIWAAEHPELVYPTWENWLTTLGVQSFNELSKPIPADIAQKLGIEPKEG